MAPVHVRNIFNFGHRLRANMNYSFRQFVYMYADYVREFNLCSFFVFPLLFRFISFSFCFVPFDFVFAALLQINGSTA